MQTKSLSQLFEELITRNNWIFTAEGITFIAEEVAATDGMLPFFIGSYLDPSRQDIRFVPNSSALCGVSVEISVSETEKIKIIKEFERSIPKMRRNFGEIQIGRDDWLVNTTWKKWL